MIERKKAAAPAPKAGYEDSTKNHIRATVRSLFRSGAKLTAREINATTKSNDARKIIYDLRKFGWKIADIRQEDGRKLYWLTEDDRQMTLNFQEG